MKNDLTTSNLITRRDLLKLSVGLAALALASCAQPAAAPATQAPAATKASGDAFTWQRFKGEKIEVGLTKGPRADVLQKYEKEFVDLTGIQVGSEQVPEQQARQKQVIEFTSGSTTFDVTSTSWHVQKRLFGKGKWLQDLRDYLKDPTMTAPELDWNDFSKAGTDYATQADGRIDTLPMNLDYWILYWNKDLFQAKGLTFPKTLDEVVTTAKALTDTSKGIYGFVARGLKNANVPVWTGFLLNYDVDSIDSKGVMHTAEAEAVASAQLYKTLLKDCAPPGVSGFNWNECQTAFMQGTIGMWYDGIGFAPPLEDPKTSKVVGKVGYTLLPAGPKKQHTAMFGDGMGLSSYSKKKGPAYFYLQWATGKAIAARILQSGSGSPPRNGIYNDQQVMSAVTFPKEWVNALVESGKVGRPGLPVVVPVTEFRDIFGVALTNMIGGADPAAELKKATDEFKPVLDKSEQS